MRSFLKSAAMSSRSASRATDSKMLRRGIAIDCHTHMYTPKYMDIMRRRTEVPYVRAFDGQDRLVILPGEDDNKSTAAGRPIGREYFDWQAKIQFMDNHKIDKSVISLANPWLDFLKGEEAANVAKELNDELQSICENSNGRLFGFATLPVRNPKAAVAEVYRIKKMKCIKGVILGTPGAGNGLDHENMKDVLHAIAENDLMIFMHPHYGVGNEHYADAGHALFLALGFPFETTVAVSRLIVSGTLDKIPNLKLFLAHAGAALPSLIGRLDSCVEHDHAICDRLKKKPSDYFKNMYFDAISYSPQALQQLIGFVGTDRLFFGTDNPFFPPLHTDDIFKAEWPSTKKVYSCISTLNDKEAEKKVLRDNAVRLLGL